MATNWQDREHASSIETRWFKGGWEFDTAAQARGYVSDQMEKYSPQDLANTPFRFTVESNGVEVRGYVSASIGAMVWTRTYRKGATMRDRDLIGSPSDCVWLIPNTGE